MSRFGFFELIGPSDQVDGGVLPLLDFGTRSLQPDGSDGSPLEVPVKALTIRRYAPDRRFWDDEGTVLLKQGQINITDSRMTFLLLKAKDEGQSMTDTVMQAAISRVEKWILAGHCWHSWPVVVSFAPGSLLAYATLGAWAKDPEGSWVSVDLRIRKSLASPEGLACDLVRRICRYRLSCHELTPEDRGTLQTIEADPLSAFSDGPSAKRQVELPGWLDASASNAAIHRHVNQ